VKKTLFVLLITLFVVGSFGFLHPIQGAPESSPGSILDSVSFTLNGQELLPEDKDQFIGDSPLWHFGIVHLDETKEKLLRVTNHSDQDITVYLTSYSLLSYTPSNKVIISPSQSVYFTIQLLITTEKWTQDWKNTATGWGGSSITIHVNEEETEFSYSYWCQSHTHTIELWERERIYLIDHTTEEECISMPLLNIGGRLYIGFEFYIHNLGYICEYHPLTNGMTLFLGDNTLYFENGRDNIIVNGIPVPTEKLKTIIGGRTILPLRFLAEYAGYTVTWDPAEEKVTLLWEAEDE